MKTETVAIQPHDETQSGIPGGPPPVQPPGGGGGPGGPDGNRHHPAPADLGLFGMKIALVAVAVLFLAMCVVFFVLRQQLGAQWGSVPVPTMLYLSTVLILISSITVEKARAALRNEHFEAYVRWVIRSLYIGLGFLVSQMLAFRQLAAHGMLMRHNPHSSFFYIATAAHGLHLLGGIIALTYLAVRGGMRLSTGPAGRTATYGITSVTALYWHFLTALWILLFLSLLLW